MSAAPISACTPGLDAAGLLRFDELRSRAIDAATDHFYAVHGARFARFGPEGRQACRDDLASHLEFLRPVLEFGLVQPMVDYLRWLAPLLASRDIPAEHLSLSLDLLAAFFESEMDDSDAAIVVRALKRARDGVGMARDEAPDDQAILSAAWPESAAFEAALLDGNRSGALGLLDRFLEQGHGLVDAELYMIQPALYEIGRKWQNNQVSVAQEHLATAIAQSVMTHGLIKSESPASNGRTVLLACVAGNNHTVGLQMVSDAFQLAGWGVQYLGGNVPTNSLLQHVDLLKPDVLALSVSFAQHLRVVREITSRLKRTFGDERPAVIVGGLALNQVNGLASLVDADAWSPDASTAIATAAKLTGLPALA